jgi:hypothetical protein
MNMKYAPGTFENPFAANSPWNAQLINALLGPRGQIKRTPWGYFPNIEAGVWSAAVFKAETKDPSVIVQPLEGQSGIFVTDMETTVPTLKIQNWPAGVSPAAAADGHCDIIDTASGRIQSFYQLRKDGDIWRAGQYNWSQLGGRGFGDPGHYMQGARAAGCPPSGGLIRKHEVGDGDTMYRHALAMSLPLEALAANPPYVSPATNRDWDYYNNTGTIPYGTRVFLPMDYQVQPVNRNNVELLKLVKTLQIMGAYVVDRNVGTPFAIYAEIGCGLSLSMPGFTGAWDGAVMGELDVMIDYLCPAISWDGYVDGNGRTLKELPQESNLLSLRGAWSGATFDSWRQAVILPPVKDATEFVNAGQRAVGSVAWAGPVPSKSYLFTAHTQGGATLKVEITDGNGVFVQSQTPELKDKETALINIPQFFFPRITAKRDAGTTQLIVSATLKPDRREVARRAVERRR